MYNDPSLRRTVAISMVWNNALNRSNHEYRFAVNNIAGTATIIRSLLTIQKYAKHGLLQSFRLSENQLLLTQIF